MLIKTDVQIASMDDLVPLIRERLAAGQSVNFSPKGVSMLPMIRQGRDTVVLSPVPSDRLRKYDIPLYRRENGQYVLHRVVSTRGGNYTCIGDNQFEYERGIGHDQVIAVVSAYTRDGVRYETRGARYGLYCIWRHYSRPLRRVWRGMKRRARCVWNRLKR